MPKDKWQKNYQTRIQDTNIISFNQLKTAISRNHTKPQIFHFNEQRFNQLYQTGSTLCTRFCIIIICNNSSGLKIFAL